MSAAGRSREDALISLVGSLRFEDLPDSAIEAALALILDQFTCALLGLEMPWTQSLRAVVGGSSSAVSGEVGGQLAYVYGEPSGVTPETAALVNGTAAHGFDLDDLHFER